MDNLTPAVEPDPQSELVEQIRQWRHAYYNNDAGLHEILIAAHQRGAEAMRERIADWLETAEDQAAEVLCSAIWAENRKQRQMGEFRGQPYFNLTATAIRAIEIGDRGGG